MERNKQSFTLILSSLLIMSFLPPKACVYGQFGAEPEEDNVHGMHRISNYF